MALLPGLPPAPVTEAKLESKYFSITRRSIAMPDTTRLKGVLAPVVTPFQADLSPAPERFIAHCRWLLSQHVGLAVFGRSEEHTSELQSRGHLVCRLLLEKKKKNNLVQPVNIKNKKIK